MTADRWRRVEHLYHAARERPPEERDRFLEGACADDQLRAEVESLLQKDSEADAFLEAPALEVTARALAEGRTRSMQDRTLGHYEISGFIGAGGMGEVYRARDPRIGRDVAIKVLPPGLAAQPDRLGRFEQEARSAGALNHPNIVTVYDVGIEDGAPYVVYELLEGETLCARLRKGPVRRRKALEYARHIALGLAAAHEKGITHRDLKPENVFVTRDGRVKILDFGLSKLAAPEGGANEAGSIWGTPGYIAPEQLRGAEADHRADLFNVGAVLYEMLIGRRPFEGSSATEILSAIENCDPMDRPELAGVFDQGVGRLLRRCLEKKPSRALSIGL
jgi:serine/threonine protein kinase